MLVDQPTVEDTISILRGLKERFEIHHGVRITDSALIACATLSDRYISDRFLPDKAIDLMDEAASKIRTEIDSMPAELDEISRKIMQLEIEKQALGKETDAGSKARDLLFGDFFLEKSGFLGLFSLFLLYLKFLFEVRQRSVFELCQLFEIVMPLGFFHLMLYILDLLLYSLYLGDRFLFAFPLCAHRIAFIAKL